MRNDSCYNVCAIASSWSSYAHHWHPLRDLVGNQLAILLDTARGYPNQRYVDEFSNWFHYNEEAINDQLKFFHQPSNKHYWNHYGNRRMIWFYAALRMMLFYLNHPDKQYYWFFDDDVRVNDWNGFLEGFENDHTDFLSYYMFKDLGVNSQPGVPNVNSGMSSFASPQSNWFHRFPGEGDNLPPTVRDKFGSFFAVVRFSNDALAELVDLNRYGYRGYSEGFVPSVLNELGYSMNSIFRSDDTSPYFDVEKIKVLHKNNPTTWSWI